jgi:hypothetical protein
MFPLRRLRKLIHHGRVQAPKKGLLLLKDSVTVGDHRSCFSERLQQSKSANQNVQAITRHLHILDPKLNSCLVCKFKEKAYNQLCVCNRHTNSSPPLRWPLSHFSYPPGFHQKTKVGGSFQLSPQTTCRYSRCPRPAKRGQVRRRFPFSPGAVPRHHPFSMAIFREIQDLASGRPSFMETPRRTRFICISEISQGLLLIFTHHTFLDPKIP